MIKHGQKSGTTPARNAAEFVKGDRVLVADDAVVYHYDCYQGTKPPFEDALVLLD